MVNLETAALFPLNLEKPGPLIITFCAIVVNYAGEDINILFSKKDRMITLTHNVIVYLECLQGRTESLIGKKIRI